MDKMNKNKMDDMEMDKVSGGRRVGGPNDTETVKGAVMKCESILSTAPFYCMILYLIPL